MTTPTRAPKRTIRKRTNRCPTCKQDMTHAPHDGISDCPQCGQGINRNPLKRDVSLYNNFGTRIAPSPIITQRLSPLAEATARLAKAERLVAKWQAEATWMCGTERHVTIACLRRCAAQLSRILKP